MSKNIAVIASDKIDIALADYLLELPNHDYNLTLYSNDPKWLEKFQSVHIPTRKIFLPDLNKKTALFLYLILLPVWQVLAFFFVLRLKIKKNETIIHLDCRSKIILTLPAKMLKIKNVWLECPRANFKNLNKLAKKLYALSAKQAKIIVWAEATEKEILSLGIRGKQIIQIPPGIKLNNFQRQENIFTKLAQTDLAARNRKFFTLAAVADLESKNRLETLFISVKNCLTVIPNLQLIIIGEGAERKDLQWLAKKMEIDNLVWFVGKQNFLHKWLESVSIYVYADECLCLSGISPLLQAMQAGLPLIGPKEIGLDNIIQEHKNGFLFEPADNEDLAQAIISLKQNRRLYEIMKENSKALAANYSLDKSVEKIMELL